VTEVDEQDMPTCGNRGEARRLLQYKDIVVPRPMAAEGSRPRCVAKPPVKFRDYQMDFDNKSSSVVAGRRGFQLGGISEYEDDPQNVPGIGMKYGNLSGSAGCHFISSHEMCNNASVILELIRNIIT
jgi:hypothetical protein